MGHPHSNNVTIPSSAIKQDSVAISQQSTSFPTSKGTGLEYFVQGDNSNEIAIDALGLSLETHINISKSPKPSLKYANSVLDGYHPLEGGLDNTLNPSSSPGSATSRDSDFSLADLASSSVSSNSSSQYSQSPTLTNKLAIIHEETSVNAPRTEEQCKSTTKSSSISTGKQHHHNKHSLTNGNQSPISASKTSPNSSKNKSFDIDNTIEQLLERGLSGSYSSRLCVRQSDIFTICQLAVETFLSQPTLLELGSPVKVVGDIHGQFHDLIRMFMLCGMPPKANYLFLGDYVDRGKLSVETILLLFCFKIKYPGNFFLLRGNHECASITRVYGFYDECKRRCSVKVWKSFIDAFNTLPLAATIGGKIYCVHGGLSPTLHSLDEIKKVVRPTDIPDTGFICDLLWSDPDAETVNWSENDRGISYCFGKQAVSKFCRDFGFDLVCRAHMVVENGYEFFNRKKLVTIFSAPNYYGQFNNWGAVMSVSKTLLCNFELLKPLDEAKLKKAMKRIRSHIK